MQGTGAAHKIRYHWVDTMRFLGMFAVYLGHMMDSAGKLYAFVYAYHVPLFFFLSGFFAANGLKNSFRENLSKRFFTILVPYFGFCLLNLVMFMLDENGNAKYLAELLKQSLLGIRGQGFAWALWFLPCLFVIAMLYDLLYRAAGKFRHYPYLILLIAAALHFVTALALPDVERFVAHWFFSIDSALYFLVYYAAGAAVFPLVKDKSYATLSFRGKAIVLLSAAAALWAGAQIYFHESGFKVLFQQSRTPQDILVSLLQALVLIYLNYLLAHLLSAIALLRKMGQNTLIYCGTEHLSKNTVYSLLSMARLYLNLTTPFVTCLYTMIIMVLSHYTIIPFIRKYLAPLSGVYSRQARTAGEEQVAASG
ncbi:MAG TPA: acyltransferase family protein [Firmicutes bacterium]|nr:acyltransferase family protein [Bacillota bacterium]